MNTLENTTTLDIACAKFNLSSTLIMKNSNFDKEIIQNRIKKIKHFKKQLDQLLSLPKIEQKSEEWYALRQNMITASDFAQALGDGKFGTVKQFYQKKCDDSKKDDAFSFKTNPFFVWGNMFEPVAIDIYSHMNHVKVHNFGLLQHPKHSFFGASPDGISDLGIMVEIKCPLKRKISGDVPLQYYYQIQGQLDVCGLEECDYFECEFVEVKKKEELRAKSFASFIGIIIYMTDESYTYSKVGVDIDELFEWDQQYDTKLKRLYWYLNKYNKKKIIKNEEFLNEKFALLRKVWETILFYRNNKEAFLKDILQEIKIHTEMLQAIEHTEEEKPVKLTGWSFVDDDMN